MNISRRQRLAAISFAFTLLFCLAVGLGVHSAFEYQVIRQERFAAAGESELHQTQTANQPSAHVWEAAPSTAAQTTIPTDTQPHETIPPHTTPSATEPSLPTQEESCTSATSFGRKPGRSPAAVRNDKKVYLTFDDGPSQNTLQILRILKEYHAKATFFVVNSKYNSYMKNIVEEGHAIALHSFSHDYKTIYRSEQAFFEDLQKISDVVKRETGVDAKVIRFPGGSSNTISRRYNKGIMTRLTQQVEEKGYVYFDWNCSSGDADGNRVPASQLLRNVQNGSKNSRGHLVILMHDSQAKTTTVEALPKILHYLNERGFTFETITPETPPVHHGVNN